MKVAVFGSGSGGDLRRGDVVGNANFALEKACEGEREAT
jgi:hypothetical protein